MELDHVAVVSRDIAASVTWYVETLGASVLYQDATWAFLKLGRGKLALVTPGRHPPHVAVRVDGAALARAASEAGQAIDRHRDGTTGIYVSDPDGNPVELICYPAGETLYGEEAQESQRQESERQGSEREAAAGTSQQPG